MVTYGVGIGNGIGIGSILNLIQEVSMWDNMPRMRFRLEKEMRGRGL